METNHKISVIVTAYNEERYIGECIESILRQDYDNFEVIVVDDGSSDKSGQILDNLALTNECLRVIHQNNAGVTQARKIGFEHSSGDYVCFVDGDDTVKENYLSKLASGIKEDNDIIIKYFGYDILNKTEYIKYLLSSKFPWGLVNKLFKKELLNGVFTTKRKINIGEDLITNILITNNAKTMSSVVTDAYNVRINLSSVTRSRKWELEYENLFIETVEHALGEKVSLFYPELRCLRLNSWKNLVINNVKVPSKDPLIKKTLKLPRKGRITAGEFVLRFVPFHSLKRFLLKKLQGLH